jgi:hypothetical protein
VRPGGLAMRPGGLVLWPIMARFVMHGLGIDCFYFFIISRSDSFGGFPSHLFPIYLYAQHVETKHISKNNNRDNDLTLTDFIDII